MEKTVLCQRACGKFCRGLTAAFVRVRDWKGLRVRRTFWDWGRGTLETSMNLPLLEHWYRTWSREELKWDIVFARLFFPGLLTTVPLYSNHGSTPRCASFEARTCMLAQSCTDLWSNQKRSLQQPNSLDANSDLKAGSAYEEHLSISSCFPPVWTPVATSLVSS